VVYTVKPANDIYGENARVAGKIVKQPGARFALVA